MRKIKFLKEIINSDFSILNSKKVKNTNINNRIKINKIDTEILDLLKLNKSLKQFLNSLTLLHKNNGSITILSSDQYICALLTSLVKEINLSKRIFIYNSTMHVKKLSTYHMLILLDTNFFENNNFLPRIFEKNITTIHTFNVLKEQKTSGLYKVFNEINDLKKIIFFFLLIKNIMWSRRKKIPDVQKVTKKTFFKNYTKKYAKIK